MSGRVKGAGVVGARGGAGRYLARSLVAEAAPHEAHDLQRRRLAEPRAEARGGPARETGPGEVQLLYGAIFLQHPAAPPDLSARQ